MNGLLLSIMLLFDLFPKASKVVAVTYGYCVYTHAKPRSDFRENENENQAGRTSLTSFVAVPSSTSLIQSTFRGTKPSAPRLNYLTLGEALVAQKCVTFVAFMRGP